MSVLFSRVEILLERNDGLLQQTGFLHAGAITSVVDSACGYAALTLMPEGNEVLSVEFKINLMSPAADDAYLAIGIVERSGRTLSICRGELRPVDNPDKLVALMQATMITVAPDATASDDDDRQPMI